MYQILFFSIIAVIGLAIATVAVWRTGLRMVPRVLFTVVFGLLTVGAGFWCFETVESLRDNGANATEEAMAARLRACAARGDREAVVQALKAAGVSAEIIPRPYLARPEAVYLPEWAVAQSASYVSLVTDRVRSDTASAITSERLEVIFLFDAQERLVTWSYRAFSVGD